MNKIIATTIGLLCSMSSVAQYFGTPFYKAGFDTENEMAQWTEKTTPDLGVGADLWTVAEPQKFSEIDGSSTNSLFFKIEGGSNCTSVLTSPEIDAGNKKGLIIGFYASNLNTLSHVQQIFFYLEVSHDKGTSWESLFNSATDRFKGENIKGWKSYLYHLPEKYDNKKIKLRLRLDATKYTGRINSFYLDGIYVSQRYKDDADIIYTNMKNPVSNQSSFNKAFTHEEPITVRIKNNGINDIKTLNVNYQIDDNAPVKETFVPVKSIVLGDSADYTFRGKANLGTFRTSYKFRAWVDLANDLNHDNDTIAENLKNVTTDVPYFPAFWFDKNGYINLDTDEWESEQDYVSGVWRCEPSPLPGHWYVNFKTAAEDCKAVLRSRPVYFEAAKMYELRFNAKTLFTSDAENKKNKLIVYATKDPKGLENLTEIWRNEAIDKTNCTDSQVRFTIPATGAYYLIFKCVSPWTADELNLDGFAFVEAPKADAKPLGIAAPAETQYLYTNKELIRISILNNGLNPIAANTLNVCAQLNDGSVITETVPDAISVNGELAYTFKATLDLTDISRKHLLKIWAKLPHDENVTNDTIRRVLANKVAGIPYVADFTTDADGAFSVEKNLWEVVDVNNDKNFFVAKKAEWSNNFAFEYGGKSDEPVVTIPTTDEHLYSRPVMLNAGSNYRIQYAVGILSGKGVNRSFQMHVALYSLKEDGSKTEAKVLYDDVLPSTNSFENIVDIQKDGVYVIGFHVKKDQPIDYYIRINSLKITKTADNDIALDDVLIGGKYISAYKAIPLGVRVSNPGVKTIESFTLTVTSPSIGTKTQTFQKTINPLKSTFVYLDEDLSFTGTTNEKITVSVTMDNDGFDTNNSKTVSLSYLQNAVIPYAADFAEKEGFLSLDKNKDSYRFNAYETTEIVLGLPVPVKGYSFNGKSEKNKDVLISRSMEMKAGKTYKLSFGYALNRDNYSPAMEVYALNIAIGERTPVTILVNDETYGNKYQSIGYFKVPSDAVYSICYASMEGSLDIRLRDKFAVEECEGSPDLKMIEIKSPSADAVFGQNEDIVVKMKNDGSLPLNSVSLACLVADTVYYVNCNWLLEAGAEAELTFKNVDLNAPGDYNIQIKTNTYIDATPENNILTKVIKSFPIREMQLVSLDAPGSGSLGNEETVKITLRNNGKGIVKQAPIHYEITHVESNTKVIADEDCKADIAVGETYAYSFVKKVDMSQDGTYTIKVYVDMPDETLLSNDTIRTSVVSSDLSFDGGISEILNPTDGALTENESIKVKMKNFGEVDLYDIPVAAVVSKDGQIVKELSGIVTQSKAGESVEYIFTETVDMYPYGEYVVKAYTKVANDANLTNDTCLVKVKSYKIDCGVTEVVNPGVKCASGMQAVTVIVKNFGELEISNIPVKFKVGSMPQNGAIESALAPGESVTYTFPTEYKFQADKKYTITAYTDLETDMDRENDSTSKEISVTTGIDDEELVKLSVYPNPVKDVIHIHSEKSLLKSVSIYSKDGKVMMGQADIRNLSYSLTVTHLSNGLYLLGIETEDGTVFRKFIKKD